MASQRRRSGSVVAGPDAGSLDATGWVAVPEVLSPADARRIADDCSSALAGTTVLRVGDKTAGGTRRLVDLHDRVPGALPVVEHPGVRAAMAWFLGERGTVDSLTFRSPQPGFGEQRFHADDVPLLGPGGWRVVTAIVALCDFTADNGATAVIPGSHRRPDLQRHSGTLHRHPGEVVLRGRAGTVFVFCGHLLHRGTRNRSAGPRPALQVSWRLPG